MPTANRQPPPTAANRQPLFNTVCVVLCLAHVLTMKQRAFVSVSVTNPRFFSLKDSPEYNRCPVPALSCDLPVGQSWGQCVGAGGGGILLKAGGKLKGPRGGGGGGGLGAPKNLRGGLGKGAPRVVRLIPHFVCPGRAPRAREVCTTRCLLVGWWVIPPPPAWGFFEWVS